MTAIEIEYCVPCGLLSPALKTEQGLLDEFGQDVDGVTLRPGHGGVFKIRVEDEVIWDKNVHGGELDLNLITDAVRERAPHIDRQLPVQLTNPMLEHYQAEDCGYSKKVRETLTDLGASYVIHNPRSAAGETRNEQTHEEPHQLGGEDQIPFLVDHQRGVTMYESDTIVNYLGERYN